MSEQNYYDLPRAIVAAIRSADVLTGEFLKPVALDSLADLRRMGLAFADQPALTSYGVAVRSWLMRGAPSAPYQVATLLRAAALGGSRTVAATAWSNESSDLPRLTGPEMLFSSTPRGSLGRTS